VRYAPRVWSAADFELFSPRFQADPEWNGRRLELRRRLQEFGELLRPRAAAAAGIDLERRESLHHPHASNGNRVARQRTMLFRGKQERKALQRFLGPELAKDLDSAHRSAHLQVGIEERGAFWGLRWEKDAWFDLNVLVKRAEEGEGQAALAQACAAAPGYVFEVDGGGARPLAKIGQRDWRDLAGFLQPGKHAAEAVRRAPRDEVLRAGADWPEMVIEDLLRLIPLFRLGCWTADGPSGARW
jgi:hypothetical protein